MCEDPGQAGRTPANDWMNTFLSLFGCPLGRCGHRIKGPVAFQGVSAAPLQFRHICTALHFHGCRIFCPFSRNPRFSHLCSVSCTFVITVQCRPSDRVAENVRIRGLVRPRCLRAYFASLAPLGPSTERECPLIGQLRQDPSLTRQLYRQPFAAVLQRKHWNETKNVCLIML